jgi:apolipoprotein N-acyltransferase
MVNRLEQVGRMAAAPLLGVRCGGALLTAILLVLAFPTPDQGWLAWVALLPLFIACEGISPFGAAALGFLYGMAANIGIFRWLFEVPGFGVTHFLILGSFFALYPAVWCAGVALLGRVRSPLIITAPSLWIALDYLRAHAGFMAFPWGTLAQTQHQNLAILQVATFAGEYGVTFLVVLGNAALAGIILHRAWRNAAVAGLVLALAHIGGGFALFEESPGPRLRVAAIQPNILIDERATVEGRALTLNRLDRLTRVAASLRPALIAWPETAVAGNVRSDPRLTVGLVELAREVRTPIVLGVSEVEKFVSSDAQGTVHRRAYNSAYLVTPDGPLGAPYVKRVLLPFGEYVPLQGLIRWPAWLGFRGFDTVPGDSHHRFTLPDGTPFAVLICWESLFESLARGSVHNGVRLLVELTNDAWFGRTAAPMQHNIASVLRAVENRVPIVIASNTGPSQIIDPYGRIVASAPDIFREGVAVGEVRLGSGGTLYTRVGNLFALAVIGCLAIGAARRVFQGALGCRQPVSSPPS